MSLIGGSGGLGSAIADWASLGGHEVAVWGRRGPNFLNVLKPLENSDPLNADVVVYLAWSTRDRSVTAQRQHAEAAATWAQWAQAAGTRFIFVSSVLASPCSNSTYGQMKFRAELGISGAGGRSLRVGFVVDDAYPELLATKLRALPEVGYSVWRRALHWSMFPISARTVAAAVQVEATAEHANSAQPVWLATREPVLLSRIVRTKDARQPSLTFSRTLGYAAGFIPRNMGAFGRYADAIQGLTLHDNFLENTRVAPVNRSLEDDWLDGTSPWPRSRFS